LFRSSGPRWPSVAGSLFACFAFILVSLFYLESPLFAARLFSLSLQAFGLGVLFFPRRRAEWRPGQSMSACPTPQKILNQTRFPYLSPCETERIRSFAFSFPPPFQFKRSPYERAPPMTLSRPGPPLHSIFSFPLVSCACFLFFDPPELGIFCAVFFLFLGAAEMDRTT